MRLSTESSIDNHKILLFRRTILSWFQIHGRYFPWRNRKCAPYQVVIGEILLQRTRASVAGDFFNKFLMTYPTWLDLAVAEQADLEKFLKPVGLWKRRAMALISLARTVVERGGELPTSRKGLESLPGVGQYIANSILTICLDKREPLMDVNMARLIERFFGPRDLADIRFDRYLQDLSRKILSSGPARELNWGMLDFAAIVCRARNPLHKDCPFAGDCSFYKDLGGTSHESRYSYK